ncbi:hypothetical protein HELRODRAFT_73542 [Helobdella robusta]|uniref:tRNA wybutosine-synthesizing protein 3 homolog n=1 Tax=Helobdella robusta TaxID=6412 RepID=T1G1F6_HELRO|nr:hypothetical protein HELRODRAFT_73542 [Helobdella robusta]ESO09301.1 hypothetical protein HELRODRAFT_73542 [Helobdella robusta]
MNFDENKIRATTKQDLSRKGSVDEPVLELVNYINQLNNYFTTSSCSGRICVYEPGNINCKKKGCIWLYTSHNLCSLHDMLDGLNKSEGNAFFKFEPFILHVQCRQLCDAQLLHRLAIESGLKNSGMSFGKSGKITVAVRCTLSLEVPLTKNGQLLVSKEYLTFLVEIANEKLQSNFAVIKRLANYFLSTLSISVI